MTSHRLLLLIPLIALLVWAAVQDLRSRRIRNWLTLSVAWSGLIGSLLLPPDVAPVAPLQSVLGLLTGFALSFTLFALGAVGGGDVKLLAGIGAWVGPGNVLLIFIVRALVGLVIVLGQALAQGRLAVLFRNSAVLLLNLWHWNDVGTARLAETGHACRSIDRPLPFAVPVLVATVLVVVLART